MSNHVSHRHLHVQPPVAVSGHGIYLIDAQGQNYIDASGGAADAVYAATGVTVSPRLTVRFDS